MRRMKTHTAGVRMCVKKSEGTAIVTLKDEDEARK